MRWDSNRPVPWKRLGTYLALYAAIMMIVTGLSGRDRVGEAVPGLVIGVAIAAIVLIVLVKLGWTMPGLRSRSEQAALRAQRRTAGAASPSAPAERARPAPTRRTSTGPSQHPRHTSRHRKH